MDQPPGEWEQAQYWQQHTDVLSAGGMDETGDDALARWLGQAWVRTLVKVVVGAVVVTATVAVVQPSQRSAPATSADAPIVDTTGVPLVSVPGSTPADVSAGAVPFLAPGEQSVPGEPTPKPSATTRAPTSTGAQRTPAGSKAGSPTPAAVPVIAPAAGMVVRVVSRASGGSVGVSQGSTADGALIVSSSNTTATAQQWRLGAAGAGCFFLINVRSGKALDNPDGSSVDGAQMHQWTAVAGDANQIWCLHRVGVGLYSISNLAGGALLDLRDGGRRDGTAIQQWGADPAAPNANQTWQLLRVG